MFDAGVHDKVEALEDRVDIWANSPANTFDVLANDLFSFIDLPPQDGENDNAVTIHSVGHASVEGGILETDGHTVSLIPPIGYTGEYLFSYVAKDINGLLSRGQVTVTLEDASHLLPVAEAAPDRSIEPNTSVNLNGSGSSDPNDDGPLSFQWSFVTRPEGSMAELEAPNSATPSFIPDLRGIYQVQLIVTNASGFRSNPDLVTFSTPNSLPLVSLSQPEDGQFFQPGGNVEFQAEATDEEVKPVL